MGAVQNVGVEEWLGAPDFSHGVAEILASFFGGGGAFGWWQWELPSGSLLDWEFSTARLLYSL